MKKKSTYFIYLAMVTAIAQFSSCSSDEDKPQTLPVVVTAENITTTTTSATVSGQITDDGNASITEAGFVYSNIISEPTTADNKKTVTDFDEFTTELTGLTSGTIYNVRAYAINKKGTAYGVKRTFETGNLAPVASNVQITGDIEANKTVTVSYTFTDAEADDEGATAYQWYMANDAAGAGATLIADATEETFHIEEALNGKFLRVEVTPKATEGTLVGAVATSPWIGAIGEATTVTFTYNQEEVTYGIITTASAKWLDRNLGALRAATTITDFEAHGDLFQWGRAADDHQLLTRTETSAAGVTGITSTTSGSNTPLTDKFIVNTDLVGDWRIPQESGLWQGVNGINNPCPLGWRIPTRQDWLDENLTTGTEAFNKLKLTINGSRNFGTGDFGSPGYGFYWSATVMDSEDEGGIDYSYYFYFNETSFGNYYTNRGAGRACRCIKED